MTKYMCYKCNREYETNEIRFTGTNKFECVYCLGIKTRQIEPVQHKKVEEKPKEEIVEYTCGNCNYSFKRKKSALITSCPYCNKEGTLAVKKSHDASKLLKESMDKNYDF